MVFNHFDKAFITEDCPCFLSVDKHSTFFVESLFYKIQTWVNYNHLNPNIQGREKFPIEVDNLIRAAHNDNHVLSS